MNYDTQEIAKVQLLELYPEISEELAEDMSDVEEMGINESQTLKQLNAIIEKDYQWALKVDFSNKNNDYLFWYISAAKLEPRLGERYNEEGSDLEQHLGIAKMVQKLHTLIQEENLDLSVAEYLALNPNSEVLLEESNLLNNIHLQKCKIIFYQKKQFLLIC